ncbi:polymeric immunoglobulin receptor-like [Neopelma chrysocephalum]|uniref:polymeric immunoglobulin receptor-like n=1 Tax=Neopelma chrysocephalum TaxID=114329 RepID=UPI000FCCE4C0|nr:polymeric immunoglobulin receptor-like [Neopelma chrysocephalum]
MLEHPGTAGVSAFYTPYTYSNESLSCSLPADAGVSRPIQVVQGKLHGSVTVLCPSGDTQSGGRRFWCKVGRTSCTLLADSSGYVGRRYHGRILITPRESSGAFKVLINDLVKEDSGLYRCGVERLNGLDSPQEVALQVTTASALPRRPKFLSGTVGGSLSFQCHYDPKGSYEKKYLCRWEEGSCSLLLDTDGFVHESYKGRVQTTSSDPDHGTFTVVMSQLREEDSGWYWCRATSGHTEHTSSVKLHIHRELCSSQDPETTTPVKSTSSSPAASSTPTQRSIRGRVYTMGTGTKSTTVGTATKSTTVGTATKSTMVGIVTRTTSTLLPTATPGTSGTSPAESHHESSSGESHLLPAVLPALALLICITVAALALVKIKLQKKTGGERSATGSLEAAMAQTGPSPVKEQRVEETSSPGKVQESRMDSGKCRKIYAILGRFRITNFYLPYWEKMLFKVTDEELSQNLL